MSSVRLVCAQCGNVGEFDDRVTVAGVPLADWFVSVGSYCSACRKKLETGVAAGMADTSATPVHAGDPPTARGASVLAGLRSPTLRRRVLVTFGDRASQGQGELNDYELSVILGVLRTSAGKRRGELVGLGLVEDSGLRRPTDTSISAVCWRLTDVGRAVLHELV